MKLRICQVTFHLPQEFRQAVPGEKSLPLTSNTSYFQKRGYITSAIHPQHSQRSLSILNNKQIPR